MLLSAMEVAGTNRRRYWNRRRRFSLQPLSLDAGTSNMGAATGAAAKLPPGTHEAATQGALRPGGSDVGTVWRGCWNRPTTADAGCGTARRGRARCSRQRRMLQPSTPGAASSDGELQPCFNERWRANGDVATGGYGCFYGSRKASTGDDFCDG